MSGNEPAHKRVVIFVDNSGIDIVLGVFPFARHLLQRGSKVRSLFYFLLILFFFLVEFFVSFPKAYIFTVRTCRTSYHVHVEYHTIYMYMLDTVPYISWTLYHIYVGHCTTYVLDTVPLMCWTLYHIYVGPVIT